MDVRLKLKARLPVIFSVLLELVEISAKWKRKLLSAKSFRDIDCSSAGKISLGRMNSQDMIHSGKEHVHMPAQPVTALEQVIQPL